MPRNSNKKIKKKNPTKAQIKHYNELKKIAKVANQRILMIEREYRKG